MKKPIKLNLKPLPKNKTGNSRKLLFGFLVIAGTLAFILSIPKVAQTVGPIIKTDWGMLADWGDRIFTFAVAAILVWVGLAIVGSPAIMFGLFALAAAVLYHLAKKFGLFQ